MLRDGECSDIPKMILGVAVTELAKSVPVHKFEHALYQRQIVVYGLTFTQAVFVTLQAFYSQSLQWAEPWDIGIHSQRWAETSSMVTFILVELLVAYNIDSYWNLLEEGCNIQRAKKIVKTVNDGQVIALLLVGFVVGFLPWRSYLTAYQFMTLSTFVMLPCQVLIFVIAPEAQVSSNALPHASCPRHNHTRISHYDGWIGLQKTAANAEKDRIWAAEKAAKEKEKRKKAAAKDALMGGYAERMADDFVAEEKKAGFITTVAGLLVDPMVPYLAITYGLMFAFDSIYNWQFFTLLEIAIRKENLQCTVHGQFGAFRPRVCTEEFYDHPDPLDGTYPVLKAGDEMYVAPFGYSQINESCAQIALWADAGDPNSLNTANLNEPEVNSWDERDPQTWAGVRPYAFAGLDSDAICEWCLITGAPNHDTKSALFGAKAVNGGPLCNGGSEDYPNCLFYASTNPQGEESMLNDPDDPSLRDQTYQLSVDFSTYEVVVHTRPPGLPPDRDWTTLPSMEVVDDGEYKDFKAAVFIGPSNNMTITEDECNALKGVKAPSPYCCQPPDCDTPRRFPSGTCSTLGSSWPTVRYNKGDRGALIDVKPKPSFFESFSSDWELPYFVPPGQFQNENGNEDRAMTTQHCASGNLHGFHRPESDAVFFERINAELTVYHGLMRMIAALMHPPNLGLDTYVKNSYGIFGVTMLLPIYCILYNIANSIFAGLWTVIFTRALYMSMFANNLASGRVLWYVVPEDIKSVAYPIVVGILPAAAKGVGALLTLFMQAAGLTAGSEVLALTVILGSGVWIFMIHTGLRAGYAKHFANSLGTRAADAGDVVVDVRDSNSLAS